MRWIMLLLLINIIRHQNLLIITLFIISPPPSNKYQTLYPSTFSPLILSHVSNTLITLLISINIAQYGKQWVIVLFVDTKVLDIIKDPIIEVLCTFYITLSNSFLVSFSISFANSFCNPIHKPEYNASSTSSILLGNNLPAHHTPFASKNILGIGYG